MKRRDVLGAALVAALPWRRLRAEAGWRTFEITTRVDVSRPQGVSRAWLPLPLAGVEWQRALGNSWTGNASRVEEVRVGKYGVPLLNVEWAAGVEKPFVELKSRVGTRDRAAAAKAKLTRDEIALYTAPTESIPCDGIVRETAFLRAAKGADTDAGKARAIYEWVVQNTQRDPKARGCGTGNVKAMLESGRLGGKCADLNALFVGLCRSLGIPARDVYGIRVAPSALGYESLGPSTPVISRAQHCRAEFYDEEAGWVPVDPADVRKVILEEKLPLEDARVQAQRKRLFGSWEMNWIAFNTGHDVELPGSMGPKLPFLMYPNGETGGERLDELDADRFTYAITARELA